MGTCSFASVYCLTSMFGDFITNIAETYGESDANQQRQEERMESKRARKAAQQQTKQIIVHSTSDWAVLPIRMKLYIENVHIP